MTELELLLAYFTALPRYPGQRFDLVRLQNAILFISEESHIDRLGEIILAIHKLDDAIVVGLNTGVFDYSFPGVFSNVPHSCIPKFLSGLLSMVFDETGRLLDDWSEQAVSALLEGLRLVRRVQHPLLTRSADELAAAVFIEQQTSFRRANPLMIQIIQSFWELFEQRIHTRATLGFPGNGVTQDMVATRTSPWVPKSVFLDPTGMPPLAEALMHRAYLNWLPDPFIHGQVSEPFHPFKQVYEFKPDQWRVVNLVSVPKTALVSRAITITDTSSTIIGATLRESLFSVARRDFGLGKVCNIDDQTLSSSAVKNYFHSISAADLKGGSSCICVADIDEALERAPTIRQMHRSSRPESFMYNGQIYDMNVLTMGDSSAVAMLTLSLTFVLAISELAEAFPTVFDWVVSKVSDGESFPLEFAELGLRLISEDPRYHDVGDDLLFPRECESTVYHFLDMMGVTVNHRKSSAPLHNHIESCGSWFICNRSRGLKPIEIVPFRAFEATRSAEDYQRAMLFLRRSYTRNSLNFASLLLAFRNVLMLPYLEHNESYVAEQLGSPIGSRPPTHEVSTKCAKPIRLSDDACWFYRIDPNEGVSPRYSRRPGGSYVRVRRIRRRDILCPTFRAPGLRRETVYSGSDTPSVVSTLLSIYMCALRLSIGTLYPYKVSLFLASALIAV